MHYVYLIESVHDRERHYVGQTNDLKTRLTEHNEGKSIYTQRFKPRNLVCYLDFADKTKALSLSRNI